MLHKNTERNADRKEWLTAVKVLQYDVAIQLVQKHPEWEHKTDRYKWKNAMIMDNITQIKQLAQKYPKWIHVPFFLNQIRSYEMLTCLRSLGSSSPPTNITSECKNFMNNTSECKKGVIAFVYNIPHKPSVERNIFACCGEGRQAMYQHCQKTSYFLHSGNMIALIHALTHCGWKLNLNCAVAESSSFIQPFLYDQLVHFYKQILQTYIPITGLVNEILTFMEKKDILEDIVLLHEPVFKINTKRLVTREQAENIAELHGTLTQRCENDEIFAENIEKTCCIS